MLLCSCSKFVDKAGTPFLNEARGVGPQERVENGSPKFRLKASCISARPLHAKQCPGTPTPELGNDLWKINKRSMGVVTYPAETVKSRLKKRREKVSCCLRVFHRGIDI